MTRRIARSRDTPAAQAPDSASAWRAGRKRLRDHSVKKDAVIRVAARAFNERGFHNTSLDDIAAALEVTKPTIYYYVPNKEQLLFECFVAGLEPIHAALREVKDSKAPARDRLCAVLRQYVAAIASEFGWCMVRAEEQDLGENLSAQVRALKAIIDQGIRKLLREGMKDGSIETRDIKMSAFALAGAVNWIAHWYRDKQGLTPEQIGDAFVTFFEDGLRPRTARRKAAVRPAARAATA
ncbi:MAG: TetR/AcrR family transcriptional regulator [Gammaproteobacteria bacterium]